MELGGSERHHTNWQDDSAGKSVCCQACASEFKPQDAHDKGENQQVLWPSHACLGTLALMNAHVAHKYSENIQLRKQILEQGNFSRDLITARFLAPRRTD